MIVNQGKNFYDVHCDGCGECQNYQGVFSKAQLAKAIKTDGWAYKWTEEKWIHYCPKCNLEQKEIEDRKKQAVRYQLVKDLKHMADPENGFFKYFVDQGKSWRKVINQALEIIEKEEP